MDLNIGVIGLGWIAEAFVLPVYGATEGITIAAVCDIDAGRVRDTVARCGSGTAGFTDYREMLAAGGLDGVIVAVAPHFTAEISEAFLRAGVHTYVEKPPGITVTETERLVEAAASGGAQSMVAFNRRYMPAADRIRQLVAGQGPIRHATFEFFKAIDTDPSAAETRYSPLTGTGIHGVDLLRYILGDAVGVRSTSRCVGAPVQNSISAVIDFSGDTAAVLSVYWNAGLRRERYTFHGEAYSLVMESPEELNLYMHGKVEQQNLAGDNRGAAVFRGYQNGFPQELLAFVDLIRNGGETRSPLADAVKTMALIDRILKI